MAKKRTVTNLAVLELDSPNTIGKVVIINPDGKLASSGKTVQEIEAGSPLESDNVNDADPNVKKFVTQEDKSKLAFIWVTNNTDLDIIQTAINDLSSNDLAQYFLDQITF